MVTANTRYKRKSFVKRVERWKTNLVALTMLMVTLTGLLRQTAQVLLIVIASVTVFYPGSRVTCVSGTSCRLERRDLELPGFAVCSVKLEESVALSKDIGSSCTRQRLKRLDRQSC